MEDFQYIASGVLGVAAFAGGSATALLGLLIHFGISFVVAGVFILAATQLAIVRRTALLSGLVYGVAVSVVMSELVLPLSAAPKMPVTLPLVLNSLIEAAVFIGLPVAFAVKRNDDVNKANMIG